MQDFYSDYQRRKALAQILRDQNGGQYPNGGESYVPQYQPAMYQQQGGGQMPMANPMMFSQGGMFGGGAPAGGGSGGAGGAMGSLGPIAGIAAAVAASKAVEANQGNSPFGKVLGSLNAPSAAQIKEDPKIGVTTALGVPFLNGFIRNDRAAEAKPEWQSLFGF